MKLLTPGQFFDYMNAIAGNRPEQLRLGQWAFNLLYESHPEIADYVRGSMVDPFFFDGTMPKFLCVVINELVDWSGDTKWYQATVPPLADVPKNG